MCGGGYEQPFSASGTGPVDVLRGARTYGRAGGVAAITKQRLWLAAHNPAARGCNSSGRGPHHTVGRVRRRGALRGQGIVAGGGHSYQMTAREGWRRLQRIVVGWQRTPPRRGAATAAGGGPTTQWGGSAGGGLAGAGDCGRWGPQLTDDRARRWWRLHGASCGLARTTSTQAAAHAAGRGPTTVGRVRRQGPAGAGDQGRRGPWSLSDCTPPCRAPQQRQPRRISTGGKERCSEGPKNNAKRSRTRWRTPVWGAPSRLACGKGGEGTAEHHPQRPGTRIALVVRSGRGSGRDRDWRSWPGARRSGGSLR